MTPPSRKGLIHWHCAMGVRVWVCVWHSCVCMCLCVTRREEERKMGNRFSRGCAKPCKSPPLKSLILWRVGSKDLDSPTTFFPPTPPLKKYHHVGESVPNGSVLSQSREKGWKSPHYTEIFYSPQLAVERKPWGKVFLLSLLICCVLSFLPWWLRASIKAEPVVHWLEGRSRRRPTGVFLTQLALPAPLQALRGFQDNC